MGALLIGTLVWLVLAIVVGWKVLSHVGESSPLGRAGENKKVALVAIIISAISMWLMWITCYMHQMYPLISPKIEF